jgi:hypothetical protein
MNLEKLLQDIASLPPVAQQKVIDFIEFLKWRYREIPDKNSDNLPKLEDEPFIGMWRNRIDGARRDFNCLTSEEIPLNPPFSKGEVNCLT